MSNLRLLNNFERRDNKKFEAELIYLAWEAHLLHRFIEKLQNYSDLIIIIPNFTYGGISVFPVRHILESKYLIWDKHMPSSQAHNNNSVISFDLFTSEELCILQQKPLLLIVDGSYSIDNEKVRSLGRTTKFPKYPDSHYWFYNYFERSSCIADSITTKYLMSYFSPCSRDLYFSCGDNYLPVPKRLRYCENTAHLKDTEIAIFYQSCICDSDMPQFVKRLAIDEVHNPGYFDFPPNEGNILEMQPNFEFLCQEVYDLKFRESDFS